MCRPGTPGTPGTASCCGGQLVRLMQLSGGGLLCGGLACCIAWGHPGGRAHSPLSRGAGGEGGGLCWAKGFSNAPGRARRGSAWFGVGVDVAGICRGRTRKVAR